jgi:hypothetical protein
VPNQKVKLWLLVKDVHPAVTLSEQIVSLYRFELIPVPSNTLAVHQLA